MESRLDFFFSQQLIPFFVFLNRRFSWKWNCMNSCPSLSKTSATFGARTGVANPLPSCSRRLHPSRTSSRLWSVCSPFMCRYVGTRGSDLILYRTILSILARLSYKRSSSMCALYNSRNLYLVHPTAVSRGQFWSLRTMRRTWINIRLFFFLPLFVNWVQTCIRVYLCVLIRYPWVVQLFPSQADSMLLILIWLQFLLISDWLVYICSKLQTFFLLSVA